MTNLSSLSVSPQLLDLSAIRNERARRGLLHFTLRTKPDFVEGWFNREVAAALQQFYYDVERGLQPRLMIFAPPRSGKSELFSRRFPAWALGRNPDLQMIACSYASDLANRMNRDVQRIIDDDTYHAIFPDTCLNGKRVVSVTGTALRNSEIFEVVGHTGAYRSAGVGAGITGMGADIGIIDDPVKDAKEANSETVRAAIWDWYTTTFYTRLSPKSGILLGMTRWHSDDLAGRLLAQMEDGEGDTWKVVSFPAIAEEDEAYRKVGEALHPERYPLERLAKIKQAIGSHAWNALYQQRPTTKGGGLIHSAWFIRYRVLPRIEYRVIYADTAQKTGERNDYTVFQCWGYGEDRRVYLIDQLRGKWEAPDLRKRATEFWNKHSAAHDVGYLRSFMVEDKASGTGLIQDIRSLGGIPISGIERTKDKLTRVMDVLGYIESGNVCIPEDAPFTSDFITECEAFTADDSHLHDDQIDPMCDAINDMLGSQSSLAIWGRL
ncbi:phage terminase large subunit [Pseudomonas synxantha]|uniref:phage terminase large subunit n=1 Tax=Pseudomonas synxantha TaxID=47883 RepID=UPI0019CFBF17|nr:phage terminase large subunit [Pseudomonas synxantha]